MLFLEVDLRNFEAHSTQNLNLRRRRQKT